MNNTLKKILKIVLIAETVFASNILNGQARDAVKAANAVNEKKAAAKIFDGDIAEFLVKSADARMMDAQEGKLAATMGTTTAIRNYGKRMVKDQAMLLKKIKALAASKKISLPATISHEKQEGKDELLAKAGKEFDTKFMKMMKLDHVRDIKLFKKASTCADVGVRAFAVRYLPLIEDHLNKINELADKYK